MESICFVLSIFNVAIPVVALYYNGLMDYFHAISARSPKVCVAIFTTCDY